MEQTLISKKELLSRYGISYGALYRWKRKGLIPEEWFIKKSAVTGQETYFPETLICSRIDLILEHKDELGLDELAQKLREKDPSRSLVLQTVYGERTYLLREIKELYYQMENSERKNILLDVIQLCDRMDEVCRAEKAEQEAPNREAPENQGDSPEPPEQETPENQSEAPENQGEAPENQGEAPENQGEAPEWEAVETQAQVPKAVEPEETVDQTETAEQTETPELADDPYVAEESDE